MKTRLKKFGALSADEMREVLRGYCKPFRSLGEAADDLSVSTTHLSEMLSGKRSVGDAVAAQLGYSKIKQKKSISIIYYLGEKP